MKSFTSILLLLAVVLAVTVFQSSKVSAQYGYGGYGYPGYGGYGYPGYGGYGGYGYGGYGGYGYGGYPYYG
ncbi:unnamed protein product [Gordionus sp. m RMFG-2023]